MNRSIHRILGIFAALLLLWIAGTGIGMQVLDLKAILTHEPPTDPQELSMQEGMYGPAGFAVIQVSDFTAPALPQGFDFDKGIVTVLQAVHAQQGQGSGGAVSAAAAPNGAQPSNGGPQRGGGPGGGPSGGPGRGPGGRGLGGGQNASANAPTGAAASTGPAGGPGNGPSGGGGPRGGGGQMSSDERVAAIDQAVKLTDSQKNKIRAIYDEHQKKGAEIRAAQDPDMRAELAALRADQNTQIEGVLTEAQKPKFEAYLATAEPQGRGPGGGGQSQGAGPGQGGGTPTVAAAPGGAGAGGQMPGRAGNGPRMDGGPNNASSSAGGRGGPGGGPGGGTVPRPVGESYNPLAWVELRMANGVPIGQAMVGTRLEAFNALTGDPVTPVPEVQIPQGGRLPPSLRQRLKTWHRFWNRQDTPGVYVEFLAGLILWIMTVSGLIMYFRLLFTRVKQGRPNPFWLTGGGLWRGLHRVISIVAAVFLLWMSFTGTWIGFESSYGPIKRVFAAKPVVLNPTASQAAASVQGVRPQGQRNDSSQQPQAQQPGQPGQPGQPIGSGQAGQPGGPGGGQGRGPGGGGGGRGGPRNALDFVLPLRDTEVREMTAVTLNSMQQIHPAVPIKAIRLRTFGQTKQGVVISGGDTTNQYVFNADSGQPASLNEQGYPASGFPFGTQVHENIKHLHSGDYFGIPARLMNLFAGFSLAFLSISGIVMYVDMWLKRRKGGRKSPVWV